jgi:hypothetical protein
VRADLLRLAVRLGHELCELLVDSEIDGDAIRARLQQRRELIAALGATAFSEEERALARSIVALDARVIALCDERSRVVAAALVRVRQRAPIPATPGRLLTDLA